MGIVNFLMFQFAGVSLGVEVGDGKLHELNDDIF